VLAIRPILDRVRHLRGAPLAGVALLVVLLGAACSHGDEAPSSPAAAATTATTAAISTSSTPGATSDASEPPAAYIVVADPAAEALYVYGMPEQTLLAEFDHTILSAHTGTLTTPDGRFIYVDAHENELRVLDLDAEGGPAHSGAAPIPADQVWSAVDPSFRYYVGSRRDDTEATFTLIDLDSMEVHEVVLPISGEGEPHVALGGDPLTMYAYVPGSLNAIEVEEILHGHTEPPATLAVDAGAHSQVIAGDKLYTSLTAFLHVVEIDGPSFGAVSEIAWNADGLEGGRIGRMRLTYDGGHIQGALAATVPPEQWQDRKNDLFTLDLSSGVPTRTPLATAIVGRAAMSETLALYPGVNPAGDAAYLVDLVPSSATFGQVVRTVELAPLGTPPVAGTSTSGTHSRAAAMTPDGTWGFVTHGGDGIVSVIETATGTVTTIETPSTLDGSGYLAAWEPGGRLVDLIAR